MNKHAIDMDYSFKSNLALNEAKKKWMLVSTHQMSRAHALHDYYPAVSCNGKLLESVTTAKILGVHTDEHLTWSDHVTALLSSCFKTTCAVFVLGRYAALKDLQKTKLASNY